MNVDQDATEANIDWKQTYEDSSIPEDERREEERYLQKVVSAYKQYREYHLFQAQRKQDQFTSKLPRDHQILVQDLYSSKLARYRKCVDGNANLLDRMLTGTVPQNHLVPSESEEINKVRSVMKQMARDWSSEGSKERMATYEPIKQRINQCFSALQFTDRRNTRILVPGAGLARLAFDLAMEGYWVQANEVSMYMLIASNFILNKTTVKEEFEIFPYIHTFSNHLSVDNQMRSVKVPDIQIAGSLQERGLDGSFSMAAGDFIDVYSSQHKEWDCVVTCYFLDTASDIIAYLKTIWTCLKPGGVWINHGPLLYHHEDTAGKASLELSLDELLIVAKMIGFEINDAPEITESSYCADERSMLTYRYHCALFQCTKPIK